MDWVENENKYSNEYSLNLPSTQFHILGILGNLRQTDITFFMVWSNVSGSEAKAAASTTQAAATSAASFLLQRPTSEAVGITEVEPSSMVMLSKSETLSKIETAMLLLCCYVGHGNQMSRMTVTQKLFWGHNNTLEAFFKASEEK